jgi:hypothetical protein
MSFREKSAWVMGALMTVAGLYYLNLVVGASGELGAIAPPVGIFIAYTVLVVIGSVVAQVALAISSASAPSPRSSTSSSMPTGICCSTWCSAA